MDLILATKNAHKLDEIRRILVDWPGAVRDLRDVPGLPDELPETGDTFVHNALEKARFIFEATGQVALADDSGIEADALGGAPGVFSKRFSPEGTDDANNRLLIERLRGRDRRARYRCVIAVVGPGFEGTVDGACEGQIAEAPRGHGGFGYDPYFLPDDRPGFTMAELSMDEKNAISHRGRALARLPALLARFR
jgi:XTP/dITP diphosphohydrolase